MKILTLPNGSECMIDDEDYELSLTVKWTHNVRSGYVHGTKYLGKIDGKYKQQTIYLHVLIMGSPEGFDVDHKDGNKLNNQKSNLRICTRTENNRNKSTRKSKKCLYKGVTYLNKSPHKPYRARITYDGKKRLIGDYETQEAAAMAYNKKAIEYFGEYARLNEL